MQVWNVLHVARWKYRTQKWRKKSPSGHYCKTLSGCIFATKAHIDNRRKNLWYSNTTCPHTMVYFGPLVAEICWRVWGIPANFNGFCVSAELRHGTLVVGVSQTSRHWTEGTTYIQQGGHHVGHWPTFLVKQRFGQRRLYICQTDSQCATLTWLPACCNVTGAKKITNT